MKIMNGYAKSKYLLEESDKTPLLNSLDISGKIFASLEWQYNLTKL